MKTMTLKCQSSTGQSDELEVSDDGSCSEDGCQLVSFEVVVACGSPIILLDAEQAQALGENLIKWAKKNVCPKVAKTVGTLV